MRTRCARSATASRCRYLTRASFTRILFVRRRTALRCSIFAGGVSDSGGFLPIRPTKAETVEVPSRAGFAGFAFKQEDREMSTTIAFVRMLTGLLKSPESVAAASRS